MQSTVRPMAHTICGKLLQPNALHDLAHGGWPSPPAKLWRGRRVALTNVGDFLTSMSADTVSFALRNKGMVKATRPS